MMERKVYEAVLKRFTGEGVGVAVLARLGVKDRDNDVLVRGLLGSSEQQAPLVQSHDWKVPPFGRAVVREREGELVADFALNLDSAGGREWASVLKFDLERGPLQQWSWAFTIPPGGAEFGMHEGQPVRFLRRIDLHEVSPVVVGASIGSRTLALKGDLAEQTAAVVAEYERIRQRGAALDGLVALARPFPGEVGYKVIPHHEVREDRTLAVALVKEACDELKIPMAAAVELIREARETEIPDFYSEKGIGGLAYVSERKIFFRYDLRGRRLAELAGHEAYHLSHRGSSEQEAERFGSAFAAKALGPAPRRSGSWSGDQLVAAAAFVRHRGGF